MCLFQFLIYQAPDVESREDLIKKHYMARIAELTSHLQLADSKSVHFHAEVSIQAVFEFAFWIFHKQVLNI